MSTRVRRTKAEIAAGVTLEQKKAQLGGIPQEVEAGVTNAPPKTSDLAKRLRASNYDGGFAPAVFAAMILDYVDGVVDHESFEADFPEIFS